MTKTLTMRALPYFVVMGAVLLAFSFFGCGGGDAPPAGDDPTAQAPTVSVKLLRLDGQEMDFSASPIPLSVSVEAIFSEAMNAQAVEGAAALVDGTGNAVPGAFTWNTDTTVATFKPQKKLLPRTTYRLVISPSATSASSSTGIAAVEQPFTTMTAGDINGDGTPDLVVASVGLVTSAVHLYSGAALAQTPISPMATITGVPLTGGFGSGTRVAMGGDVDADGYADVLIGVPTYDSVLINDVGAALFFSGTSLFGSQPIVKTEAEANAILLGRQQGSFAFGSSISGGYDVDGDGYDDIVVGEPADAGHPGAAYVFSGKGLGSGTKTAADAAYVVTGNTNGDRLGDVVAGLRDVDGDGRDEIMTRRIEGTGRVYVFRAKDLSNATPLASAAATVTSSALVMFFGVPTIAPAGDVDGDGIDDMLVSFFQDGTNKHGAYIFGGKDLPATGTANLDEASAIASFTGFDWTIGGLAAAGAGDVDGDGRNDVIVHQRDKQIGATFDVGEVWINGLDALQQVKALGDLTPAGAPANEQFGYSVSGIGDVDGDGRADMAISSRGANAGKGAVNIFSGAQLSSGPKYTINGATAGEVLGESVAGAYR